MEWNDGEWERIWSYIRAWESPTVSVIETFWKEFIAFRDPKIIWSSYVVLPHPK